MSEKIVIIGGGPVGSVLALALQQQGIAATVLEARAKGASHADKRALALSYGSRTIFEKLGVWKEIEKHATAIHSIHISQRGGLGRAKLHATDHSLPALGYVVAYGALTKALDAKLENADILYQATALQANSHKASSEIVFSHVDEQKTLSTPLLVIADGGNSLQVADIARETKAYGHDALVSKVACEMPHDNIAYERFTPQGPMALLPNGERDFSLVWTGEKSMIDTLLELDDATFLAQLHVAFGDRVGKFLSVEKRISFPLKLSTLKSATTPHLVVIGNAAQTMHPVAGQGFNVGLRDAWELAQLITLSSTEKWGSEEMLKTYDENRRRDTKGGVLFTDFLVSVFSNDLLGVSALRSAGIGFLDVIRPIKSLLVDRMSFGK